MPIIIGKAFLAIVMLFSAIYIPLQIPSIKSKIFPTALPILSPTPKIPSFEEFQKQQQPSERALKVASTLYISAPKSSQQEFERKMLSTGSASLTVSRLAKELDADPAKMALSEAWIAKNLGGSVTTESNVNYSPPQQVVPPNTNTESSLQKYQAESKQQCQDQINKYTICLADYNAKLNEYQECYSRYSGNSNLHPEFLCTKPSNFCYKPACAY